MKITLHIDFGKKTNSINTWECGGDVEFDPGSVAEPQSKWLNSLPGSLLKYRIRERTLVRASLRVPSEWLSDEFKLQAGMDPDNCICFSRHSYENGVMLGDDRNQSDVLYDTMGPTLLQLILVRTKQPLLVVKINVEPDPAREEVMRGVVGELTRIAPHVISSSSEWQNVSAFSEDRRAGAASYAAPGVELKAISALISRLTPILWSISRSPAWRVEKNRRMIHISRAKKIPKSSCRKLAPCFNKGGSFGLLHQKIEAYVCARSSDVNAHRVISSFLLLLKVRLDRIYLLSLEQQEKYSREIAESEQLCTQIPHEGVRRRFEDVYRYRIESLRKHKSTVESVLQMLKLERARLNQLRRLPIFNKTIMHVCTPPLSQDFEYDVRYQRCLCLMIDYENGHHWWKPLEDGRGWTHTMTVLDQGRYGNSLQRKYSILFEYWCCYRLLIAFEDNGVDFADAREKIRSRLARSVVVECEEGTFEPVGMLHDDVAGDIEVRIIHNYSAYSPSVNPGARFMTTPGVRYKRGGLGGLQRRIGEQFLETPDMAVVLRNMRTGRWFWVTVDAKSTDSLRGHQVVKQSNYLNQLHRPNFDLQSDRHPWASWLVYAGNPCGVAGLENVQGEDVGLREWSTDEEPIIAFLQNGQVNSGIECSVQNGLMLNEKSDKRFMGQIRANPVTTPLRGDSEKASPFFDFARMMIATARNNLC